MSSYNMSILRRSQYVLTSVTWIDLAPGPGTSVHILVLPASHRPTTPKRKRTLLSARCE